MKNLKKTSCVLWESFLTSSLKFLKAATRSSTLSGLRGRSFNRSITWRRNRRGAGLNTQHQSGFEECDSRALSRLCVWSQLHSRRRLGPRDPRGTRQRTSSGLRAGRKCCRPISLLRRSENDTCMWRRGNQSGLCIYMTQLNRCILVVCLCVFACSYLSAMATAVFFSLSLLDEGALTWAITGLNSLFISSSTLSGFYEETNTQWEDVAAEYRSRRSHRKGKCLLTLASS